MISFYKPNAPLLKTGPSKVNLQTSTRYSRYLSLFAKNRTLSEYSYSPPLKKREWTIDSRDSGRSPSPPLGGAQIQKMDQDFSLNFLDQLKKLERSFLESLSGDEKQSTINDWYADLFRDPLFKQLDIQGLINFAVKSDYRLQLGVLMGMADEGSQIDRSSLSLFYPYFLSIVPEGLSEDGLSEIRDHLFSERFLSCLNSEQLFEFIEDVCNQEELIQGDYANFFIRIGTFVKKYIDQNSYSDSISLISRKILLYLEYSRISKKDALLLANGFFLDRSILAYFSKEEKDDLFLILLSDLKKVGIEKNEGELFLEMAFSVDDESKKYPREKIVPWMYEFFLEGKNLSEIPKQDQHVLFFRFADSLMQIEGLQEADILDLVKVFNLAESGDQSWVWSHEIFRKLSVEALDQINQSS